MRLVLVLAPFLWIACNGGGLALPGSSCAAALDEKSCDAIAGCLALTCPACGGGDTFLQCVVASEPHGVDCSNPCSSPACASISDAVACDARADCHSLFSGDLPCNASGCASHFVRCDDGATASCVSTGDGACHGLTPQCRPGDATTFLPDGCAAGCIHASRCAGSR